MAIIDAVMGLAFPTKTYFLPPSHVLAKLYSNNFLMILNNRLRVVNGRGAHRDAMEVTLAASGWGDLTTLGGMSGMSGMKSGYGSDTISMSRLDAEKGGEMADNNRQRDTNDEPISKFF
jgi:hypothetical protein